MYVSRREKSVHEAKQYRCFGRLKKWRFIGQRRGKQRVYACATKRRLSIRSFVRLFSFFRRRMADSLTKYGLYIDDLSKICILEPEVANQTNKLKEECQNFVTRIAEFQKNCNKFIDLADNWANEVEKEKMRTIGARNLLRSVEKQRDAQKQQIQALIIEKSMELERLRIQYDSLRKIEMEQLETIEHLTVN